MEALRILLELGEEAAFKIEIYKDRITMTYNRGIHYYLLRPEDLVQRSMGKMTARYPTLYGNYN